MTTDQPEAKDWTAPAPEQLRAARKAAEDAVEYAVRRRDALYPPHRWVPDQDGTTYCRRCLLPSARWTGDLCPDEWAVSIRDAGLLGHATELERARRQRGE